MTVMITDGGEVGVWKPVFLILEAEPARFQTLYFPSCLVLNSQHAEAREIRTSLH